MKAAQSTESATQTASQHPGRTGLACLAVIVSVLGLWWLAPAIPQDQAYHQFADQRPWLGVPHAADVLSNVAFAVLGIAGVVRLLSRNRPRFRAGTEAGLWCIAVGIMATAAGSAWYHLDPGDGSLVWDRLPMTLVFAGILGTVTAQRVGSDTGRWVLAALVPLGIVSVAYWHLTGDLSLYLTVQYGGIAVLAALLALMRNRDEPIPWLWVVVFYVAAKLVEAGDRTIWNATNGLVAGHALKHLLAAPAVAAALWPLLRRR